MTQHWFFGAAIQALEFLRRDFGYGPPHVDDHLPNLATVTFVGAVAVQARLEPREEYLSLEVLPLVDGAMPTTAPIVHIPVGIIVQMLSPEAATEFQNRPRPDHLNGPILLSAMAEALRAYASGLLRGDMAVVEDIRQYLHTSMAATPGVPGVDWWAEDASTSERV